MEWKTHGERQIYTNKWVNARMIMEVLDHSSIRVTMDIYSGLRRLQSNTAVKAKARGPVDHSTGPLTCCALGRIRTCNLLIRSQMLYPLSYECLFCFGLRFGPFRAARGDRKNIT